MLPVSVVIRTLNEADALDRLFRALKDRTLQAEELIVVDNESTDDTTFVAHDYGAKVVTISRSEFSYPKSLNAGMQAARFSIVVSMVGHALPVSDIWLESAFQAFDDERTAGVYSAVKPGEDAGRLERTMYNWTYRSMNKGSPYYIQNVGLGSFAATCHAVRRAVWMEHPFDERYGAGGEDVAWARWALTQGYKIAYDSRFAVYHSHGLNAWQLYKQIKEWKAMLQPYPFNRHAIAYRRRDEAPST